MIRAVIETAKGTIRAEFDDQHAPITVKNLVDLAKHGFYDGLTFHRVEPGFVIQGGDPAGNGTGGSGDRTGNESDRSHRSWCHVWCRRTD